MSYLKRLYKDIEDKNEAAKTGRTFDIIEHDFINNLCQRCSTSRFDIDSGAASWVCSLEGQKMSCCDKMGYNRYSYERSQWECSECHATISNDPNYNENLRRSDSSRANAENIWQGYTQIHPKPFEPTFAEKKCECGAHKISSNFHSNWCPLYGK